MKDSLEEKLFTTFPNLYKQKCLTPEETCMCWGFCCDDGWYDLIYDLSKKISQIDPEVEVIQVKEKFGGLRFYVEKVSKASAEEIYNLITIAENKSLTICENCGSKEDVSNEGK